MTVKEQQEWKIPPCISNWKNAKVPAVILFHSSQICSVLTVIQEGSGPLGLRLLKVFFVYLIRQPFK